MAARDGDGGGTTSARRRRVGRLRSWWRHEAQSVRAAVATVLHHSCDVGRETYNVLRHQKMATAREEVVDVTHSGLRAQKTPPPGARPGCLADPEPQRSDRSLRRFAGDALPTLALPSLAGSAAGAVDRLHPHVPPRPEPGAAEEEGRGGEEEGEGGGEGGRGAGAAGCGVGGVAPHPRRTPHSYPGAAAAGRHSAAGRAQWEERHRPRRTRWCSSKVCSGRASGSRRTC